jgi:protoporphyrin/coproporphyrin ferrochelatase
MKQGVLLANLGSPDSPSIPDVRRYLKEFLMDGRVLDAPKPVRWMIVNLFILPFRPKNSAHAYQKIWQHDGSPLILFSKELRNKIADELSEIPISLGMRYGNPSLKDAAEKLRNQGVEKVILVPLYPHYAMSSFETVVAKVQENESRVENPMRISVMPAFYNRESYIDALYRSATDSLSQPFDHYLFSYHGLPERHLRKTDITGEHCLQMKECCSVQSSAHQFCYRHQVMETSQLFAGKAGLPEGKWSVAFQSRLGRDPWLTPNTADHVVDLAKHGVKRLWVIAPSFVSDCLETLEELKLQIADDFRSAGGEFFYYAPAMNTHESWIKSLASLIREQS